MPNLESVYQAGLGRCVDGFPGGLVAILAEGAAAGGEGQGGGRAGAEKVTTSHIVGHGIRLPGHAAGL